MSVQNIVDRLLPVIENEFGVFGIVANIGKESGFSPINLQNTGNTKLNMTDEAYTKAVDDGAYTNFIRDSLGYGFVQWTYWSRKQALYEFAKSMGVSIGDENMQIDFIIKELQTGYKGTLSKLKSVGSLKEATKIFMEEYERPADQSETALNKRVAIGEEWYQKIKGVMVLKSRAAVVNLVNSWLGKNESDGSYKSIIDIYNSFTGAFPRGTKMQYGWAWCACTWSALAIKLGYISIMPIEISCFYLIEAAKKMGIWVEDDAYVPSPGDAVLYDWQDNGVGDNTGIPDHIGTVTEVYKSADNFVVVEGNYSNAVKKRTLSINGRYIRGFITPKYDEEGVITPVLGTSVEAAARAAIAGAYGNGEDRKKAVEALGLNYDEVQARINEILNVPIQQPITQTEVMSYDKARKFDKSLAGTYKVTASDYLYLRHGAGTNKQSMAKLLSGTQVKNYGYYSESNGVKWLYIEVKLSNGVKYIGFSSSRCLKKV